VNNDFTDPIIRLSIARLIHMVGRQDSVVASNEETGSAKATKRVEAPAIKKAPVPRRFMRAGLAAHAPDRPHEPDPGEAY
jgi:hypothetical protein